MWTVSEGKKSYNKKIKYSDTVRSPIYLQTYLGIGTTPSGFQLNSLYPVDVNTDETFAISASHGTPIYATAIVENFAGLRSVFRSKKVVNDHTPPVIQDILVEKDEVKDYHILNTSDVAADEMMLRLRVSWDASDEESGIKACFVSVGRYSLTRYVIVNIGLSVCTCR